MSKSRNNIPRAAIHVGAPAKSFSAAEGYEPERRGWDEKTYRLKNQDTNNHYDFSRKHLNFEINNKGKIVPPHTASPSLFSKERSRPEDLRSLRSFAVLDPFVSVRRGPAPDYSPASLLYLA